MWDEQFEQILRRHLPFLPAEEALDGDLALREFGLDSLGIVELLSALERAYDVRFTEDVLTLESFENPAVLWETVSGLAAPVA